eukprot:2204242-Ditylum_brightwellii.AAC.1
METSGALNKSVCIALISKGWFTNELKFLMSLNLRTPLCKTNNSALVVAPVGSPCLDTSQWVAIPLVRNAMDV